MAAAARTARPIGVSAELEERQHVARGDLEGLGRRHAGKEPLRERARVRPVALDVREVRREHDVVHAHVVTQLDGHALDVLHAEVDVLADVVARALLERLEVEQPRGPVAVPLVPVVRLLHPERHPAESRLGEEDPEIGKAIEDAGQDHLGEAHGRCGPQKGERHPLDESPAPEPGDAPWDRRRGYSNVGSDARGPRRSKPTCTVSGIFMSMAAAQNRSSSGVG